MIQLLKRILRGNWIEKVSVEELEREKMHIDNQITVITREVKKLEDEKKKLFREGLGKSDVEKLIIAEKIKDLDLEVKMKLREYNKLMKQRRALSNLIRLKKWEEKLREEGVWDKIKSLEPEKLIQALSSVEFEESSLERNVEKMNEILEVESRDLVLDEASREIIELWSKVEKAELTPEDVEEKLEVKLKSEDKETVGG